MKQSNSKMSLHILLIIFLLVIASFNVAAFGIVMPYWEDRPLIMEPGETKDIALNLQNVGESDITLEVKLAQGSEIAKITDKSSTYIVPKGSIDTKINMRITLPQGEKIGTEHVVSVSIKEISTKGAGMVQLTNSIDKSFMVVAGSKPPAPKAEVVEVPKPTKEISFLPVIIAILIIAIVVVAFYLYGKRQKPKLKRKTKFK